MTAVFPLLIAIGFMCLLMSPGTAVLSLEGFPRS